MSAFDDLIAIVARLRGEDGCPWDRAQTTSSMRPYLLEETYEVLHAIDRGDDAELAKELGDLLFQGVMLSRMAEERGAFDIGDVLRGIADKMVERHPHVFDEGHAVQGDEGEVRSWEARKAAERPDDHSALDGVPETLPALLRAHRISEKASGAGFDWSEVAGVRAKVDEELRELDQAIAEQDDQKVGEEFGDLLFTLVNLGRFLPVGAEEALRAATAKFETRFRALERALAADARSVYHTDPDTLESYWAAVKEDTCS
ncbi:MAG: nucleoside triphosphate pyrophosphohydrolase [Deltaproteobacteria bacterium]|nr:nucleoside triphosphate pyrophosphohydrolase [Deltaproteobacteria bacterium]MBW2254435.1 nucleoside triphosphate pyrophosphohydrolase [Deltaproteobacteria bacterium]